MNNFSLNTLFNLLALSLVFSLSGCKVGDEDPLISLRSRDNRIKANWKMGTMENRYELRNFEVNVNPVVTQINTNYNGYDVFIQVYVNGVLTTDTTFGFSYLMNLQEKGETTYDYTVIYAGLAGLKSGGKDSWYWLNTDEKKSRVHLGNALQYPMTFGLVGQAPPAATFAIASLINDFGVEELRNQELTLTFNKSTRQTTATGGVQEIILNSKMTFDAK